MGKTLWGIVWVKWHFNTLGNCETHQCHMLKQSQCPKKVPYYCRRPWGCDMYVPIANVLVERTSSDKYFHPWQQLTKFSPSHRTIAYWRFHQNDHLNILVLWYPSIGPHNERAFGSMILAYNLDFFISFYKNQLQKKSFLKLILTKNPRPLGLPHQITMDHSLFTTWSLFHVIYATSFLLHTKYWHWFSWTLVHGSLVS